MSRGAGAKAAPSPDTHSAKKGKQRNAGARPLLSASQRILRKIFTFANSDGGLSTIDDRTVALENRTLQRSTPDDPGTTTAHIEEFLRTVQDGLDVLKDAHGLADQVAIPLDDEPDTGVEIEGEVAAKPKTVPRTERAKGGASSGGKAKQAADDVVALLADAETLTWGKLVATKRWHPKAWAKAEKLGHIKPDLMERKAAEASASRKKKRGGRPSADVAMFPCPGCLHDMPGPAYQQHVCHAIEFGNEKISLNEAVLLETLATIKYGPPLGDNALPRMSGEELAEVMVRMHTETSDQTRERIKDRLAGKKIGEKHPTVVWEERLAPIDGEPLPA